MREGEGVYACKGEQECGAKRQWKEREWKKRWRQKEVAALRMTGFVSRERNQGGT